MKTSGKNASGILLAAASFATASVLAGCGLGSSNTVSTPIVVQGSAIHGSVYGGQQAVVGATIQLYATGSGGYGTAAAPLIAKTITTGPGGSFDVTNDYTCPSDAAPTYLVATGGNSGYSNNPNLALMAALGPCGALASATFVSINEVTTVASVYALSAFMGGTSNSYTSIATSTGNAAGMVNAMNDVNLLANVATGATPGAGIPAGATIPSTEIYTLADITAACINSSGGTANDTTACGTLFGNANPGGTAPTDTITALMDIAQHPGGTAASLQALYNLSSPQSPFQPTLTAQPNDFTLAVTFAGGAINAPSGVAVDQAGNVWLANAGGNTVTELTHAGAPLSGAGYTGSFNAPSALALAGDGTVWVTNAGNNTVSRLSTTGSPYAGSPYAGGGLNVPASIAFDAAGTAWVANSGNGSVTAIASNGSAVNYTPAGSSSPIAIGVNPH